jgi:hypothetical protein
MGARFISSRLNMDMRIASLWVLLASLQWCFGQTDTNVIATGDWSPAVPDTVNGAELRGRLLVYDERCSTNHVLNRPPQITWEHARLYLELQHVHYSAWYNPIEIYFDPEDLPFEMHDGSGKSVPSQPYSIAGALPGPCWITLPCDTTVRLRADLYTLSGGRDPAAIEILTGRLWKVPRKSTNDYFLSCTFTPATNHASCLGYQVWRGTLRLPAVRIPTMKP